MSTDRLLRITGIPTDHGMRFSFRKRKYTKRKFSISGGSGGSFSKAKRSVEAKNPGREVAKELNDAQQKVSSNPEYNVRSATDFGSDRTLKEKLPAEDARRTGNIRN